MDSIARLQSRPRPTPLAHSKNPAPGNPWNVTVGVTALLESDFVYLFGFDEPRHDAYLLRTPVSSASAGNLSALEWWCGSDHGWVGQKKIASAPAPVVAAGSTEFSVHLDRRGHRYVEVQSGGAVAIAASVGPIISWDRGRTVGENLPSARIGCVRRFCLCGQSSP